MKSSATTSRTGSKKHPDPRDPVPGPTGPGSRAAARPASRILLVDDDTSVRESLGEVLLAEGYLVVPAENGQQAIELISRSAVDLVILDLNMPVKNGWDTFEQLTREHPLVPIIIATARANQLFTAVNSGVGALLEKPMDMRTLLETITKLLAETVEQRVARLAGVNLDFHYQPAAADRTSSSGNASVNRPKGGRKSGI